jgi:hypothetical protein
MQPPAPRRCLVGVRLAAALIVLVVVGSAHAEPTEDDLIAVITIQPRAPHAGIYVDLLLDRLHDDNRNDELGAWVDRLLKMPQILRSRPGLVRRLQAIQVQFLTSRAANEYRRGKTTLSIDAWREAARLFLWIADLQRQLGQPDGTAMFNAGVALAQVGENYAALVAWSAIQHDPDLETHARERMFGVVVRAPALWARALLTD